MPVLLKGSCRCGAVSFEVESHTPAPFMLCYCSICRKQQGGGGYAINLGGIHETLKVKGKRSIGVYRAEIEDDERSHCEVSTGERNFCKKCGSALVALRPDLAGAGASVRLGDRQRTAEAEGARPHHAEIPGVLGRARHPQGRQVSSISIRRS